MGIVEAARTILAWLSADPGANTDAPGCDCFADPCKDTPAGKKYLVVCNGKTLEALAGTADGQTIKWDNVGKTWVVANV